MTDKNMKAKLTFDLPEEQEEFIPIDKQDEATKFLSTYKDGLANDFEKKERL